MTRKPRGFQKWNVPAGVLFVRIEEDGRWVVLAGPPDVKMDNKHLDGRPHMHVRSWEADDRRPLRPGLGADEATEAVRRQLERHGYLDLDALERELS